MYTRRACVVRLLMLPLLMVGCSDDFDNSQMYSSNGMKTDIDSLKRLIHLPANVERCEWQTGTRSPHGDDWWLAAVLEVNSDQLPAFLPGTGTREFFETPPGLELVSSFAALRLLPDAHPSESGGIALIVDTYGVSPYTSSPLLDGRAIKLSANQVFVTLWTN